jgi:sugar (pentulose or hexulose) kinase
MGSDVVPLFADFGAEFLSAVRGACVSGIGPCLVAAGAGSRPLRPATWCGVDTPAAGVADELSKRYGATEGISQALAAFQRAEQPSRPYPGQEVGMPGRAAHDGANECPA